MDFIQRMEGMGKGGLYEFYAEYRDAMANKKPLRGLTRQRFCKKSGFSDAN
ncbi:MAG: hypothetical protein H6R25_1551 [Proteobacteria bacterium]|nr:hypothetical protein [Pseudomonadota bacterium]